MLETQRIDWIAFDEKMNVKSTTTLNNNFAGERVLMVLSNPKGEIFVASAGQNKLITEKYVQEKADKVASLSADLPKISEYNFEGYYFDSCEDEQIVTCSVCYRGTDKTFNTLTAKFDFSQNQTFSSSADIKDVMGLGKFKGGVESFDQTGIDYYKNNWITIQQYNTTSIEVRGSRTYSLYNSADILVSFFNEKMQPVKQLSIKEYFPTYEYMGKDPGYKIIGNKLIILTDVFDGKKIFNAKYKFRYVIIDLDKMEIAQDTMIDVNNRFNSIVYASRTVWVNNTALIFHLIDTNAFSQKDFAVKLEKLEFNF